VSWPDAPEAKIAIARHLKQAPSGSGDCGLGAPRRRAGSASNAKPIRINHAAIQTLIERK